MSRRTSTPSSSMRRPGTTTSGHWPPAGPESSSDEPQDHVQVRRAGRQPPRVRASGVPHGSGAGHPRAAADPPDGHAPADLRATALHDLEGQAARHRHSRDDSRVTNLAARSDLRPPGTDRRAAGDASGGAARGYPDMGAPARMGGAGAVYRQG